MADRELKSFEILLDGKCVKSVDPSLIGKNFQTLKNLRYADTNPKGIGGMTKLHSGAVGTYKKIRNGFHFRKEQPAETHVLMQGLNAAENASAVFESTVAIPEVGADPSTVLWNDSVVTSGGRFSDAPDGAVIYCNSKETTIWGGNESRCAAFIVENSGGTISKDYTSIINNTLTDSNNIAYLDIGTGLTLYIGSLRPVKSIKFYVVTPHTGNDVITITYKYSSSSGWSNCTNVVDGTMVTGKCFAQTGSVSFDDTVSVAKATVINGRLLYWYQFTYTGITATDPTLSHVTINASWQSLKDMWDGTPRSILSCKVIKSTGKFDYSVNVFSDTYDANDASTYAKFGALATSTDSIDLGFNERMTALYVQFPEEYVNTTAATTMTLRYWNGTAYTTVGTITDGTADGAISFGKTGYVSWTSPALTAEFRKSISGGASFYYYSIVFDKTLSGAKGDIRCSFVGGIPVAQPILAYKFPFMDSNRLYLCSNQSEKKNEVLAISADTNCFANGEDSIKLYFGKESEIMAGGSLYSQLGSNIYDMKVICKKSEVWAFTGSTPDTFDKKRIYATDGCVAPLTFDTGVVNMDGTYKPVAIWQGANNIYLFEGTTVIPIGGDILNFFDKKETTKIYSAMIHKSVGKINPEYSEYRWLFATGTSTTLNNDWSYDIKRNKWYETDMGTKEIQCLIPVMDTVGNSYMYGSLDTGYLERLEYGTTFDGDDITFTMQTGDVTFEPMEETKIHDLQINTVAKVTTTNSISVTHYGDSSTTATPGTPYTIPAQNSGKRLVNSVKSIPLGDFVSHSFKATMTTNNENVGFEPLSISGLYKYIRQKVR